MRLSYQYYRQGLGCDVENITLNFLCVNTNLVNLEYLINIVWMLGEIYERYNRYLHEIYIHLIYLLGRINCFKLDHFLAGVNYLVDASLSDKKKHLQSVLNILNAFVNPTAKDYDKNKSYMLQNTLDFSKLISEITRNIQPQSLEERVEKFLKENKLGAQLVRELLYNKSIIEKLRAERNNQK